jgi:hypothetical protein
MGEMEMGRNGNGDGVKGNGEGNGDGVKYYIIDYFNFQTILSSLARIAPWQAI